ncbi:helix-turn-helix transcriptional regulator [Enterococcus plantarum]|uniref:helix-turn-helix transcriptional regulator n=1 Tax=Enterococcus plantarum TaxID=1077675 RepID=UPI001A8DAA25|nr:helix-turn-helix transcriptional regulator [Enterococcus plantarum]MBO0466651.1 helix-turn-helix transcriptional regulator [Enterococcus plantarum]
MKQKKILSKFRDKKGYSQLEISSMMSVTQQSISSWETGRTIPKPYQMKQLAEILEVEMDELFYDFFNVSMEGKNNVL